MSTTADVDITDPATFAQGIPHEVFAFPLRCAQAYRDAQRLWGSLF